MPAYVPNLGEFCAPDAQRDAIHQAVVPVVAAMDFGWDDKDISIMKKDGVYYAAPAMKGEAVVAVVDPFLEEAPQEGDRFWALLYPNTVVGLRHVYTHPALDSSEDL